MEIRKTFYDFDKMTDDEKIQFCNKKLEDSKEWMDRTGMRDRWARNLKTYLPRMIEPAYVPVVNVPLSLSNVQTILPELIDKWPSPQLAPQNTKSVENADMFQMRFDTFMEQAEFEDRCHDCAHDGLVVEMAFLQLNYEVRNGLVYGVFSNVDPYTVFPAPGFVGTNIMAGEATYFGYQTPKDIDWCKREIGKNKDGSEREFKAEGRLEDYRLFKKATGDKDETADACLFKEIYFPSEWDFPVIGPDGKPVADKAGKPATERRTCLRKFFWLGKYIIFDGPQEFDEMQVWQYINYRRPNSGRGISEVHLVCTLQETNDEVLSNNALIIRKLSRPFTWMRKNLFNKAAEFMGRISAGLIVTSESKDDFNIVPGANITASSMSFPDTLYEQNQRASGVRNVMSGEADYAGQPASAVLALKESAMARVHLKLHNDVLPFLKGPGRFVMRLLLKYDKVVKEMMQRVEGGWLSHKYDPTMLQGSEFDVDFVVGGSMPKGRAATEARAIELLKAGLYTPQRAIMSLMDTNKTELLTELNNYSGYNAWKAEQEQAGAAEQKFSQTCIEMLDIVNNQRYIVGDIAEITRFKLKADQAAKMLLVSPDLLNSGVYMQLPVQVKDYLLNIFRPVPEKENVPQIAAPKITGS